MIPARRRFLIGLLAFVAGWSAVAPAMAQQDATRPALSSVGQVGQRLDRHQQLPIAAASMARIDNRVQNRIQSRLQLRIDRTGARTGETARSFAAAADQARATERPRR